MALKKVKKGPSTLSTPLQNLHTPMTLLKTASNQGRKETYLSPILHRIKSDHQLIKVSERSRNGWLPEFIGKIFCEPNLLKFCVKKVHCHFNW